MKAIVINGPMGVGKTAVGKWIADRNVGTAFIDGDWCFDLHPFVGNRETKEMAVDNILHMIGNYQKCTHCRMIVLVWLMDDEWVRERIADGITGLGIEIRSVTLVCSRDELMQRWASDHVCEWRTDEWLDISLQSLPGFERLGNCVDTTGYSIEEVAGMIVK